MENIHLLREAQQRMARITALRNIDLAISSSMDIHTSLRILLDEVVTQLGVDAATVLLFNPYANMLEFTAGRGFRSQALQHTRLHLGEGNAGQAALQRKIVIIHDLTKQAGAFTASPLLNVEGFISYFASPLLAKGQIKGVLEIFHRSPLDPDAEWLEFLETLAGQAAIAIENAQMFNELQRSNLELELAYNHTLEGWVRALDMRDDETEGHTQRVTTATIFLARQMGMNGTMMEHLRRGALLHDIGKIAIPDHILRKPGPLTDEEWEVMRRHPVYAYEMLAPINYLLPALDIPYYHHERWDGSGYPNGLKGEQIPLPARIFAVVDVWDALNSDRPYRRAWPKEQVITYIRTQSGTHFDPRVVEHFLELLPNLDRSAISQIIRT
jgi:HD-GYP domain-containing protein (c-di-GMP phosphodiesterase class II)